MLQKRNTIKVLMIGDVVGDPGMAMCRKWIRPLREKYEVDAVIVNAENAGKCGRGMSEAICETLLQSGTDLISSGNHVWRVDKFHSYLDRSDLVVRPANYPETCPGKGYAFFDVEGVKIAVLNLMGRVFMRETLSCPFREAESLISLIKQTTNIIFVDFHAEATSEKQALGHFLDGKVSAVVGTHTHVQTADEIVLDKGTAFMCDLGFTGPINSCIGVNKHTVIKQYLTQMPARYCVELRPPYALCGAVIEVDKASGTALGIERIRIEDQSLKL
jgi:metallophosphoesterase (TIGR00282 family)